MSNGVGGQVLGASTMMAAGIAVLPDTGSNQLAQMLSILAIILGAACLLSLIITRILRRVI